MKLSRKQLKDFIFGSIRDCEEYGPDDKQERDALDALRNGTLEIEGYERSQWIKFDPNDPKTYPPELTRVQVFDKESGEILTAKYDYDSREWSLSWCMITHWRPLPPTPVETEAKNEAE